MASFLLVEFELDFIIDVSGDRDKIQEFRA